MLPSNYNKRKLLSLLLPLVFWSYNNCNATNVGSGLSTIFSNHHWPIKFNELSIPYSNLTSDVCIEKISGSSINCSTSSDGLYNITDNQTFCTLDVSIAPVYQSETGDIAIGNTIQNHPIKVWAQTGYYNSLFNPESSTEIPDKIRSLEFFDNDFQLPEIGGSDLGYNLTRAMESAIKANSCSNVKNLSKYFRIENLVNEEVLGVTECSKPLFTGYYQNSCGTVQKIVETNILNFEIEPNKRINFSSGYFIESNKTTKVNKQFCGQAKNDGNIAHQICQATREKYQQILDLNK